MRSSLEIELLGALYSVLCGLSSIIICLGISIHTYKRNYSLHKRKLNRSSRGSIIRSFVMGFVFLGIGIYGLYSFRIQANALMQVADLDTSLDPYCS